MLEMAPITRPSTARPNGSTWMPPKSPNQDYRIAAVQASANERLKFARLAGEVDSRVGSNASYAGIWLKIDAIRYSSANQRRAVLSAHPLKTHPLHMSSAISASTMQQERRP